MTDGSLNMITNRPYAATSLIDFDGTLVPYLNDDNPRAAYDGDSTNIKFVAQPLYGTEINEANGVIPIPLMMTDEFEILLHRPTIVEELRAVEKKFDYMFVGQCGYAGREVFRELKLVGTYYFRETKPVYGLPKEEKLKVLTEFLFEIAQAKFIFAPRGVGSSSFRAYQAMMVGSVPIITGMNDLPFTDVLDWDKFCIHGDLNDIENLISRSTQIDYSSYVGACRRVWDSYCEYDALYGVLKEEHTSHVQNQSWEVGSD